jgi:hypothetical protein
MGKLDRPIFEFCDTNMPPCVLRVFNFEFGSHERDQNHRSN